MLLEEENLPPSLLKNKIEYIQTVNQGISGNIVKQAVKQLDQRDLFVRLLETDSANLSRFYSKKTLTRSQSEGILDFLRLFQKATEVFDNSDLAKEWLQTRLPVLNGECAIDLCDTFEGRKLVTETLDAIEYGEFS